MSRLALHLSLVLSLAFFSACNRAMDRAEIVVLNGAEPESIDPALLTGQADGRIAYTLFEGLTSFDQTGTPQPGVAERWDLSADAKTYTFHFRKNAKWSNGDPVTSEDFIRSWERTLKPATASEYAGQLYYIHNARPFNEGTVKDFREVGVQAPNPHTLIVTLDNPTPFFIDLTSFNTLLPVHMPSVAECEKRGETFMKPGKCIGNGAFVLKEWRIFDRIRVEKNPHYWNAANIPTKSVDFIPTANPMTAFNLYSTGVADVSLDKGLVPTPLLNELKKRPDYHAAPFLGNYFLRFNVTRKPFTDPRVRLALTLSIDKQLITEKITRAGEVPADSFTPPNTAGYYPPPGLKRDVARAKQLLAEAGFPDGKGFPIIYYLYKGELGLDRDIAVELQGMWRDVLGITVQLQQKEWKVYLASLTSLDYDIARSSWVGDYKDANTFLGCFVTDDGNNRTGWSNKRFDECIAAAGAELDREKRFGIFREAEKLLVTDEVAICPLYYYVGVLFFDDDRLGGIQSNLTDEHPIKSLYWKKR
ncbi:MAG: peptide ABC transporter substrate-binding protein [Chthoniobacteraceae bacterium]